jgi:hypothetical protein
VWVSSGERRIPVRAQYREALLAAKNTVRETREGDADEDFIVNLRKREAINQMSQYVKERGAKNFDGYRAVNTWRVWALTRVPLPVLARGLNLSSGHIANLHSQVRAEDVGEWSQWLHVLDQP